MFDVLGAQNPGPVNVPCFYLFGAVSSKSAQSFLRSRLLQTKRQTLLHYIKISILLIIVSQIFSFHGGGITCTLEKDTFS